MKTICLALTLIFTFLFNPATKNQETDLEVKNNLTLKNLTTGKVLVVTDLLTAEKIELLFGKAGSIKKEPISKNQKGEDPWTTVSYNGLKIELTGKNISDITITNKDWMLKDVTVGMNYKEVQDKYKKIDRKFEKYILFQIPDFDGVLFIGKDKNNIVTKIGISAS